MRPRSQRYRAATHRSKIAPFQPDSMQTALHQPHTHTMTAALLAQGLRLLKRPLQLFIVHMEAGREHDTMREVPHSAGEFKPQMLQRGRVFDF